MRPSRGLDAAMIAVGLLLALALVAGALLTGCGAFAPAQPAAAPAPLAPLYDRANALAPRVTAHGRAMEAAGVETMRARVKLCPLDPAERQVCVLAAHDHARSTHLAAQAQHLAIEARHRDARTALTAAAACRSAGNEACAAAERAEAERALVEVEAALDTPTVPTTTEPVTP